MTIDEVDLANMMLDETERVEAAAYSEAERKNKVK